MRRKGNAAETDESSSLLRIGSVRFVWCKMAGLSLRHVAPAAVRLPVRRSEVYRRLAPLVRLPHPTAADGETISAAARQFRELRKLRVLRDTHSSH